MMGTMLRPATSSAHHKAKSGFRTRPPRSVAEDTCRTPRNTSENDARNAVLGRSQCATNGSVFYVGINSLQRLFRSFDEADYGTACELGWR